MKEFAKAMAKAQSQIKTALKDTKGQIGQNRSYKYADLTSVWDACKQALSSNDIAVIQKPDFDNSGMWLETMLLHASGESVTGRYPLRPAQDTPQAYGSAITYAKRYSLSAMVGVVTEEDDDGNAASQRGNYEPPARPAPLPDATRAAKSYVDEAIKAIGTLTDATSLNAWVEANKSKLERLRDVYDEGSRQVSGAILETRKTLMRGAAE
jgi:hypothetical protein